MTQTNHNDLLFLNNKIEQLIHRRKFDYVIVAKLSIKHLWHIS